MVVLAIVSISPVVQKFCRCRRGSGRSSSGSGGSDDRRQETWRYLISKLAVSTRICQSIEVIIWPKSSLNCLWYYKHDHTTTFHHLTKPHCCNFNFRFSLSSWVSAQKASVFINVKRYICQSCHQDFDLDGTAMHILLLDLFSVTS